MTSQRMSNFNRLLEIENQIKKLEAERTELKSVRIPHTLNVRFCESYSNIHMIDDTLAISADDNCLVIPIKVLFFNNQGEKLDIGYLDLTTLNSAADGIREQLQMNARPDEKYLMEDVLDNSYEGEEDFGDEENKDYGQFLDPLDMIKCIISDSE